MASLPNAMPRAERRLRVREEALSLLREQGHMLPQSALADVVNAVSDAVVGMGPIEFLLKDPEISEVMLNIGIPDRRGGDRHLVGFGSLRTVPNSLGPHGGGLPCERSHEGGEVLRSRCNIDYGPADECEGCDTG